MSSRSQQTFAASFQNAHDFTKMTVYDFHEAYAQSSKHVSELLDMRKIEARPYPKSEAITLHIALTERCIIADAWIKAVDEELRGRTGRYTQEELELVIDELQMITASDQHDIETIEKELGYRHSPKI